MSHQHSQCKLRTALDVTSAVRSSIDDHPRPVSRANRASPALRSRRRAAHDNINKCKLDQTRSLTLRAGLGASRRSLACRPAMSERCPRKRALVRVRGQLQHRRSERQWRDQIPQGDASKCHTAVSVVRMRFRYTLDVCCKCLLQISVTHLEKQTHRMRTRQCTMSHLSGGSSYLRVVVGIRPAGPPETRRLRVGGCSRDS